jgi:hypothetical protein
MTKGFLGASAPLLHRPSHSSSGSDAEQDLEGAKGAEDASEDASWLSVGPGAAFGGVGGLQAGAPRPRPLPSHASASSALAAGTGGTGALATGHSKHAAGGSGGVSSGGTLTLRSTLAALCAALGLAVVAATSWRVVEAMHVTAASHT